MMSSPTEQFSLDKTEDNAEEPEPRSRDSQSKPPEPSSEDSKPSSVSEFTSGDESGEEEAAGMTAEEESEPRSAASDEDELDDSGEEEEDDGEEKMDDEDPPSPADKADFEASQAEEASGDEGSDEEELETSRDEGREAEDNKASQDALESSTLSAVEAAKEAAEASQLNASAGVEEDEEDSEVGSIHASFASEGSLDSSESVVPDDAPASRSMFVVSEAPAAELLACQDCAYETASPLKLKAHRQRHGAHLQSSVCFRCQRGLYSQRHRRMHRLVCKAASPRCAKETPQDPERKLEDATRRLKAEELELSRMDTLEELPRASGRLFPTGDLKSSKADSATRALRHKQIPEAPLPPAIAPPKLVSLLKSPSGATAKLASSTKPPRSPSKPAPATSTKATPFRCPSCAYSSSTGSALLRHVKSGGCGRQREAGVVCCPCGFRGEARAVEEHQRECRRHLAAKHKDELYPGGHDCRSCSFPTIGGPLRAVRHFYSADGCRLFAAAKAIAADGARECPWCDKEVLKESDHEPVESFLRHLEKSLTCRRAQGSGEEKVRHHILQKLRRFNQLRSSFQTVQCPECSVSMSGASKLSVHESSSFGCRMVKSGALDRPGQGSSATKAKSVHCDRCEETMRRRDLRWHQCVKDQTLQPATPAKTPRKRARLLNVAKLQETLPKTPSAKTPRKRAKLLDASQSQDSLPKTPRKASKCPACPFTAPDDASMTAHFATCVKGSQAHQLKLHTRELLALCDGACPDCGFDFPPTFVFHFHKPLKCRLYKAARELVRKEGDEAPCPECGSTSNTKNRTPTGRLVCHWEWSRCVRLLKDQASAALTCDGCSTTFESERKLDIHKDSVYGCDLGKAGVLADKFGEKPAKSRLKTCDSCEEELTKTQFWKHGCMRAAVQRRRKRGCEKAPPSKSGDAAPNAETDTPRVRKLSKQKPAKKGKRPSSKASEPQQKEERSADTVADLLVARIFDKGRRCPLCRLVSPTEALSREKLRHLASGRCLRRTAANALFDEGGIGECPGCEDFVEDATELYVHCSKDPSCSGALLRDRLAERPLLCPACGYATRSTDAMEVHKRSELACEAQTLGCFSK